MSLPSASPITHSPPNSPSVAIAAPMLEVNSAAATTALRSKAFTARSSPANFCAGGADVRRYHPVPANSVGARVHDVWLVNAAVDAEAKLAIADAVAPIRLWRRAHGAHGDGREFLFRLVLLDVIGQRELRATNRRLLVEA